MSAAMTYESTESVIELLWDIALAVCVFRLAIAYAFGVAALFALLAWADYAVLPGLPFVTGDATALGFGLGAILLPALCARLMVSFCEVPRVGLFRLAIGGTAVALWALVGGLSTLLVPWLAPQWTLRTEHAAEASLEHAMGRDYTGSSTCVALTALAAASLALMPWLSMLFFEGPVKRTTTMSEPVDIKLPTEQASVVPVVTDEKKPLQS